MLRFPRRYPLSLLVLLIPLALLLYAYFGIGQVNAWARGRFIPLQPSSSGLQPVNRPVSDSNEDMNNDIPSPSEILLVSSLFPLSSSKHAAVHDASSLSSLLEQLSTDIYFFAPPSLVDSVRASRGSRGMTLDTRFASPLDIPPLLAHGTDYERMRENDRDRARARMERATEVYADENAKVFFLAEALRQAGEGRYKYAFWVDADAFIGSPEAFSAWPDLTRVEEVWKEGVKAQQEGGAAGLQAGELLFVPIHRLPDVSMQLWNENLGPIKNDFAIGMLLQLLHRFPANQHLPPASFFGGPPTAVAWLEKTYFAYHDLYLRLGHFVGSSTGILNSLFLLFPERVITVWAGDPFALTALYRPLSSSAFPVTSHYSLEPREKEMQRILGDCGGDSKSYFQFFLASEREQSAARAVWDAKWDFSGFWPGNWDWSDWEFWKEEWWARRRRASCRVTRTLAVQPLLRRLFGEWWKAPSKSVHV